MQAPQTVSVASQLGHMQNQGLYIIMSPSDLILTKGRLRMDARG